MKDVIIRGTAGNNSIRVFGAFSKETVEEARKKHNLSPTATAALGRLLTGGAMMGAMLKNDDDLITLQIAGDGPIGKMLVTSDNNVRVKGFVGNPDVNLPIRQQDHKLDVGGAVGRGVLTVIKDMGLKEPYAGQVELQTGEIAEDLTYYFAASEQTPSCVGLGVLVNKEAKVEQAGGFIVQLLPNAEDEIVGRLERNITQLPSVTSMLNEGKSIETILETILEGLDFNITDRIPLSFSCNCSRQRIEKALISIGEKELDSMIEDGNPIIMNCHFCNTDYEFSKEELIGLKNTIKNNKQ